MAWKDKISGEIRQALEKEINETAKFKTIYNNADNKAVAQLWVAIANLSKDISDLNKKIDNLSKKKNMKNRKKSQIEKVLKKF